MQSFLLFFLYNGITIAVLRQSGNIPLTNESLMQWINGCMIVSTLLNSMLHGMVSGPLDGFLARAFTALITSSVLHGCRNIELGGSPLRKAIGSVSVGGTVSACIFPTLA